MKFPFFLIAFIIFTAVLAVKRQQQTRAQDEVDEAFVERERKANATRKQDISRLNYLPFHTQALPMGQIGDADIASYEAALSALSDKRIINLSSYSNTDLKLMYGPANLDELTEYDENYHTLSVTLFNYADRARELNHPEAAIQILEYAMSLSIDSSHIYLLLAELYLEKNMPEKIDGIRDAVSSMEESLQKLVLPKLPSSRTDE